MTMNMPITIESHDESTGKVLATRDVIQILNNRLSFRPEGYMFNPKYQAGIWDGWIRPVGFNGVFNKGLLRLVMNTLAELGYDYSVNEHQFPELQGEQIPVADYSLVTDAAGNTITPFEYQIDSVKHVLDHKRAIIQAPTGAGKSLIIYLLARSIVELDSNSKILILVPNVSLTTQLFSDVNEYTQKEPEWKAENWIHKISAGKNKNSELPVYISTWQSLYTIKDKSYFSQFTAVIVDETHKADASSITNIVSACTNAKIKTGLTGTLKDCRTHITALTGLLGIPHVATTTKELMESGILTTLQVNAILLDHEKIPRLEYKDELDFLVLHQRRNKFIASLTELHPDENWLILYQFVTKHGKPLYEYIRRKYPERNVYLINGTIKPEDRENVRKLTEENSNVIIVASYQTFQEGINIKNLHNVIFSSPSKSPVRVFQSIGRALRKHSSKKVARLYDIGDNLTGKSKSPNYTLKHFNERIQMYHQEEFLIKFKQLPI